MFFAAFTSRSCIVPHSGHTHDRTDSGMRPILWPHSEHVLLVGSKRPHLMRWTLFHTSDIKRQVVKLLIGERYLPLPAILPHLFNQFNT